MIKLVNKPTVRFSRRQEEIRWKTVTATTAESVKGLLPMWVVRKGIRLLRTTRYKSRVRRFAAREGK